MESQKPCKCRLRDSERLLYLNGATDKQLIMSLMNDRFQALVSFVVLGTLGIGGAIFYYCIKILKKNNSMKNKELGSYKCPKFFIVYIILFVK